MSFPAYDECKTISFRGVDVDVPSHWVVAGLTKYLESLVDYRGRTPTKVDEGVYLVTARNIKDGCIDYEASEEFIATDEYEHVMSRGAPLIGDVLFTTEAPLGQVANMDRDDVALAQRVLKFRGRNNVLDNYFLKYWIMGQTCQASLERLATGSTALGIKGSKVGQIPLAVPSIDEQKAISSFLDVETSKIDGLVSEQRRLIELLKEKRQAVISHAVTKGLNPNAPIKPSGIQWLGDVPEHWETNMISRITSKIGNGYVGPTRDILVEEGVPYVQATHIKNGRVNFDGAYFVTEEWSEKQSKAALELGDVLIVQTGAGTGDIGLVSEEEVGYRCHALIIVRTKAGTMLGSFLAAALQSQYGVQTLESIQTGGMHPHLNCGNVKFVRVPIPPIEEQQAIVDYVKQKLKQFSQLQAEAERAIELLQERRTAVISAAVTGKIDVRKYALQETA